MTTTLYLVRHGETDWNAAGRWQGHTDIALNERGRAQSRVLAQRLRDEGIHFDAIYSSDLARAFQTAWEIGAAVKVAVQMWPPLRELDVGSWSGLTRDEIRAHYPDDYQMMEQGTDFARGGGETMAAMRQRVTQTVEAIVQQHPGETLALVTHGGVVRVLVRYLSETYGIEPPPLQQIGNTSITIVRCLSYMWQLDTFNDMTHLRQGSPDTDLISAPPDDTEQAGRELGL